MAFLRRNFSILNRIFGIPDKSSAQNKARPSTMAQPLAEHKPIEMEAKLQKITISQLKNGIRVLTETPSLPSNIQFGVLFDVGSRDETENSTGSLMALKHTYLRSDEENHYNMIQMTGGELNFDYDQENTLIQGHCMPYDILTYFSTLKSIVKTQRSQQDCDIIQSRSEEF